jgi:hypothetical protein
MPTGATAAALAAVRDRILAEETPAGN